MALDGSLVELQFKSIGPDKYVLGCVNADSSDYWSLIQMFKPLYIFPTKEKAFIIPTERVFEIELWLQKKNYTYRFLDKEPEYAEPTRETKFDRSATFNGTHSLIATTPYSYQREAIDWAIKRNRVFIADDPGLGKSFESISYLTYLFHKGKVDGAIFLVKKQLAYHWKREILEHSLFFKEEDIEIIDNTNNKSNPFEAYADKKVLIIHEHLWAALVLAYGEKRERKSAKGVRWYTYLSKMNIPQLWNKKEMCLILDESHYFKSSSAIKSKALAPFLKFFEYRVLLSATPAINGFANWWNQLRILDPAIIPMNETAFIVYIAKSLGDKWNPYKIIEYDEEKVALIRSRFQLNIIKRLKSDLPEMKTKQIIKPIYFRMEPAHLKLYNAISEQYLLKIEQDKDNGITLKNVLQKFPYLLMALENPHLLKGKLISDPEFKVSAEISQMLKDWTEDSDAKIAYLDDYLAEKIEESNEKVVLFDIHPMTLNMLGERYKKYNPMIIHGQLGDSDEIRQTKIDNFNNLKHNCQLALMSTMVGSVGLNLNKGSRNIIYLSLPFDATLYRQSIDRTHRINSTMDSLIEELVYGGTIDEMRYKILKNRVQLNDHLLTKNLSLDELKNLLNGQR